MAGDRPHRRARGRPPRRPGGQAVHGGVEHPLGQAETASHAEQRGRAHHQRADRPDEDHGGQRHRRTRCPGGLPGYQGGRGGVADQEQQHEDRQGPGLADRAVQVRVGAQGLGEHGSAATRPRPHTARHPARLRGASAVRPVPGPGHTPRPGPPAKYLRPARARRDGSPASTGCRIGHLRCRGRGRSEGIPGGASAAQLRAVHRRQPKVRSARPV
jgi:hypothetical protein